MAKFAESVYVQAAPDAVWSEVGNVGGISAWLPFITESRVEGDTRYCVAGENGNLVEQIVARDEAGRSYEYTISEAPMPIDFIHSAIDVVPDGSGTRVTWSTTVTPPELIDMFRPIYVEGLENLKVRLEA
jgi:hypothetical protein